MISDTEQIDIDILGENNMNQEKEEIIMDEPTFDIDGLREDLQNYNKFKEDLMTLLNQIEKEIFEKQTQLAI